MKICHACKKELSYGRGAGRRDSCPTCRADIHCCLNCALYDHAASKQCREPIAELVKEKNKANFCDYFVFAQARPGESKQTSEVAGSRKALDDLFKK